MRFKKAVVLAARVCLVAAIVLATSGSTAAEVANARQRLDLKSIAIPSSIKGEKITSATLSGTGLLALGTATGRLMIVDRNMQAWRGGWERREGSSAIRRITFSQDEAAIAGMTREALIVWRLDDGTVVKIPFKGSPTAMALSRGGRLLAVTDFDVSVFDVSSRRLIRRFEQDVGEGRAGTYKDVAFTADAGFVAAAALDSIDTWNVASGKRVQHWSCKCGADGVAFAGDAVLAVVGTADAHALVWERASGTVVKDKTISTVEGDHVYGTAASLNGALVAAGTASGSIAVWDTRSGVILASANPSGQPITGVASSHDGQVYLVEGQQVEYERDNYDRWLMTLPLGPPVRTR